MFRKFLISFVWTNEDNTNFTIYFNTLFNKYDTQLIKREYMEAYLFLLVCESENKKIKQIWTEQY